MKGIWAGIVIMVAGIVWDITGSSGVTEETAGVTPSGWVILAGILIALVAAFRGRSGRTIPVQPWLLYAIRLFGVTSLVGWVWDSVFYHMLGLDKSLQAAAHLLYNGGSLLLFLFTVIATVAGLFSKKQNSGFPVN